jgi:hypothetical protein
MLPLAVSLAGWVVGWLILVLVLHRLGCALDDEEA